MVIITSAINNCSIILYICGVINYQSEVSFACRDFEAAKVSNFRKHGGVTKRALAIVDSPHLVRTNYRY
jgi:hypothetical protein